MIQRIQLDNPNQFSSAILSLYIYTHTRTFEDDLIRALYLKRDLYMLIGRLQGAEAETEAETEPATRALALGCISIDLGLNFLFIGHS